MPDKKQLSSLKPLKDESRVMPLLIAGLFCFAIAALLGIGTWRVFGSQARERGDTARFLEKFGINIGNKSNNTNNTGVVTEVNSGNSNTADLPIEVPKPESVSEITPEIVGVVDVEGGEFIVGGGDTQRPLQRVFVESFQIAETEVTNAEYAEFIKETGHRSPSGWDKTEFPKEMEDFPVVNVSWNDANAFCDWKSKKYKLKFRLPTQAEWELAARGPKLFKYPWGNDWNDEGVEPKKTDSANAVKSFPVNRSPFNAYDMLGNVWEWTSEEITRKEMESEIAKKATTENEKIYLALGGSFIEDRKKLKNTFWAELKANTMAKSLGFRYVIISNETSNNQK